MIINLRCPLWVGSRPNHLPASHFRFGAVSRPSITVLILSQNELFDQSRGSPLKWVLGGPMDSMTVAEAIELIRMNEAAMSIQFQTWLSITFATIVAAFVARNLLTRTMKWLITIMYLLACISISATAAHYVESNARLTVVLVKNGIQLNESALLVGGITGMALFFIGIATTLYFIHMSPPNENST